MLKNFYEKTTHKIEVTINYNGAVPNITQDTVTIVFKTKKDGEAVLTKNADVSTSGATGIAKFNLSKIDTALPPGNYYYEIFWTLSNSEEYVIDAGKVNILNRI